MKYLYKKIIVSFFVLFFSLYSIAVLYRKEAYGANTIVEYDNYAEDLSHFIAINFRDGQRPVVLKYIAKENKCTLIIDEDKGTVTIKNKEGSVIKKYSNVPFFSKEPVMDGKTLEHDLGWPICKHIESDWFESEASAMLAGGLTYAGHKGEVSYYVGSCYNGHYYSIDEDGHKNNCKRTILDGMHENKKITLIITETDKLANINIDMQPVLLKYIAEKNDSFVSFDSNDMKAVITDKNGSVLTRYKYVSFINGTIAIDAGLLTRDLGWINVTHSASGDLFNTERDAITAAWLSLYGRNYNDMHIYTGTCYGGHYFSFKEDEHAANCKKTPLTGMHVDKTINVVGGNIDEYGLNNSVYTEYANNRGVLADKPEDTLTSMVTVFYTQYGNGQDVQNAYFSLRDRVYRNFWDDLAGFDSNEYIFIPPSVNKAETAETTPLRIKNYKEQNYVNAKEMVNAINSLLERKPNAGIWIGTPGVTSENFYLDGLSDEIITDFLVNVRVMMPSGTWNKNVAGVYINQESIYGDAEQAKNQINHIIKAVSAFKDKNKSKKALWIPYFDMEPNSTVIAEKIAEVSQIPNLFDYIIIQSGYFFFNDESGIESTQHRIQSIDTIKKSSVLNSVIGNSGETIGSKPAIAQIGLEMEFQNSYFSNSRSTRGESLDRYTRYLMAGSEVKDLSPLAYYGSGDPHLSKEWLIYKFYDADKLNYEVVRKSLDERLNKYFNYVFETREKEKVFTEYAKNLYLNSNTLNTEESFEKVYDSQTIIIEFYKYEKGNSITDLSEYIKENKMPESFDSMILTLLEK